MNNEPKEIAFCCKGEDYKDCTAHLMAQGFQPLGFNEWCSPVTGNKYRFVLADGGSGYVTRVEMVDNEGPQMIRTEFCDHQDAIDRYDAIHAKQTVGNLAESISRFKDAHLRTSMSKVLRLIETGCKEGDPNSVRIFKYICSEGRDKLVIKDYLFCDGVVCFYSPTKQATHELVRILEHSGKKLYLYRCRLYLEDLLESLISKVKLASIVGEETVKSMNESGS